MNEVPTPPETPPEAVKPRFGRKLYLVIGLVAIAIIAAIVSTQFLLGARGEAITLRLNYNVGEKMTYNISITTEAMGTETSQEGTWKVEVLSFDGENYTISSAIMFGLLESSFTMKMNQMGQIIEYIGLSPEIEETFSSFFGVPGFRLYFPEEEVRVGESWKIPLDAEVEGIELEGKISYKLSEITSVTVPAGTYEALKITIKPSDLHATYSVEGMEFHLTMDINGYIFLENGTCRLIELRHDLSTTMTAMGQTVSTKMTMQMQLIGHFK